MRYQWGAGVGHTYSHDTRKAKPSNPTPTGRDSSTAALSSSHSRNPPILSDCANSPHAPLSTTPHTASLAIQTSLSPPTSGNLPSIAERADSHPASSSIASHTTPLTAQSGHERLGEDGMVYRNSEVDSEVSGDDEGENDDEDDEDDEDDDDSMEGESSEESEGEESEELEQ
jgi:ribonuclease E